MNGVTNRNDTYDAWGKLLTTTGSLASTLGAYNPLRYRGYVYDRELGLYYLQSRYYDPELCRFLNADAYVSTGQGELGNNMFAYCRNNPVRFIDSDGYRPFEASAIIIPVYVGQNQSSYTSSRICIPDAKQFDTWLEMAITTYGFIRDVTSYDLVQDIIGVGKAGSGAIQMIAGYATLLVPDPIPIVDEAKAVWDVVYGFIKLVTGTGEFTDWESEG